MSEALNRPLSHTTTSLVLHQIDVLEMYDWSVYKYSLDMHGNENTCSCSLAPDQHPLASDVMLKLREVRMWGEFLLCPVSQCRTGDNVSTVEINLPQLRGEIKAIHESGTT